MHWCTYQQTSNLRRLWLKMPRKWVIEALKRLKSTSRVAIRQLRLKSFAVWQRDHLSSNQLLLSYYQHPASKRLWISDFKSWLSWTQSCFSWRDVPIALNANSAPRLSAYSTNMWALSFHPLVTLTSSKMRKWDKAWNSSLSGPLSLSCTSMATSLAASTSVSSLMRRANSRMPWLQAPPNDGWLKLIRKTLLTTIFVIEV